MSKREGTKTSTHIYKHEFRALRQKDAAQRQAERATRLPKQQLAHLDKLLGPDVGANRERARLNALIEAEALAAAGAPVEKKGKAKPDGAS